MSERNPESTALSNKELERTRPAANGVTGPCRSIQCWTDVQQIDGGKGSALY
jgi:hypothetical protein